jgi:hypothetical protein
MVALGEGLDAAFAERLAAAGLTVLESAPGRLAFSVGTSDLMEFWRLVAETGAEVRQLGREHPTLEDAVVAVMEGGHVR